MDELDDLAETLTELARTMRRLTLHLDLLALRVSSLASDARVAAIPRHVVRLERQEVSNN